MPTLLHFSHRFGLSRAQFIAIAVIVSAAFLSGCGAAGQYGSGNSAVTSATQLSGLNPIPAITSISPNSSMAGGAPFTLTISGTNFTTGSTISFGTTPITSNISPHGSTQLLVPIPAALVTSAANISVTVTNPVPGGGTSNAVNFTITSGPNPAPAITALGPSCAPVGAQSFILEVIGSNFVGSSVLRWNGSNRPTTVFDEGDLTAQIAVSDIAATETASVTVFNPTPGGGSSNSSTFTVAAGGVGPQSVAVDPSGKFAYVANRGCPGEFAGNVGVGSVSMFSINSTTGALTSIGSPVAADFDPRSVTVDPSGKFVYIANSGAGDLSVGSVSMYTINATTGALTSIGMIEAPCAPPPSPGSCAPYSVAVHPSGKFVYVANEGGFAPTSVSMYRIDGATGILSLIGVIPTAGRAISVAVDPTGKFAYATDVSNGFPGESNNVAMYTINTTTGALTSVGTIAAGHPSSIAIDPSGNFAYVTNSGSNDVSIYSINTTTGALTSLGPIAAGGPLALDPMGKFAYVANSGSILTYTINATTGVLTFIGTIAAGVSPSSIAVHPSGKFAYVTNFDTNNVSMYSIDAATGALTLIGTIGI